MTAHQFIQVLALVLLVLAAFFSYRGPEPYRWHWSLGWAGMALWLLSILIGGFNTH